jgi:hypothetical protein
MALSFHYSQEFERKFGHELFSNRPFVQFEDWIDDLI